MWLVIHPQSAGTISSTLEDPSRNGWWNLVGHQADRRVCVAGKYRMATLRLSTSMSWLAGFSLSEVVYKNDVII